RRFAFWLLLIRAVGRGRTKIKLDPALLASFSYMILDQFLATGHLGGRHLGVKKAEVRRLLGEPQQFFERRKMREIWKYDGLQIAFTDDVVCFLGLYFEEGVLVLPESLLGTSRVVIGNTDDVERLLTASGLDFAVDEGLTFDDQ